MTETSITIDVPAQKDDNLKITASHFKPKKASPNSVAFFCLPGGSSSKKYFDLGKTSAQNYSFADRMTGLGHHVISINHPGTGDNPLPPGHPFLKPRVSAGYINRALPEILDKTDTRHMPLVGLGHSMGGMVITLIQGLYSPFKGLCLFGSNAGGLDWGLTDEEKFYINRPEEFEENLEDLVLKKFKTEFPNISTGPSEGSKIFAGESKEANNLLKMITVPLFAAGGLTSMVRGSFKVEADSITVPMFFAFGDRDIGIPPQEVPIGYQNATDIRLLILKNTGHNSFGFRSIELLCKKLHHWAIEPNQF